MAIAAYTLIALAGIGITGWIGYRRHSYGNAVLPHDTDTPEDRHRFLGYATLLLSELSAVATVYASLVVFFFQELFVMRRVLLSMGLLTLAAAWLGPLPQLAQRAFFAHMTMHMAVVAVAAPLIALALAGGRFDPVRHSPALVSPIPASMLEFVVVWTWHAPALHHAARHSSAAAFAAEQGMFLLTGLLMWFSAFGGDNQSDGSRRAAGVVGLLLTSMHITLLGALLALTPRPLYTHVEGISWLTSIEDQHLGGAIMLLVGGIAYLAGGLWLMVGLLRNPVFNVGEDPS